MADWVALAGIASTALVAVTAQVGTALSKRGDRQHASQLDFDKRVWEAKSAALVSVIAKCQRLKDATDIDPPSGPSSDTNRGARRKHSMVMEIREVGYDLYRGVGADLLAYADESVRTPYAHLSKVITHEFTEQYGRVLAIDAAAEKKELSLEEHDWESAAEFRRQEVEAEIELGNASTLDVDALAKLCDQIIDAARKDLRGL